MSRLRCLIHRSGSARLLLLLAVLSLGCGAVLTLAALRPRNDEPLDRAAYDLLMATRVRDWNDLLDWFYEQQEQMARIIPPGLDELIQPGTPDLLVLDSEPLQKELASSKPAWLNSVPVWELELQESFNGEITIRNGSGELIHTFPAPPDYQIPYEALFRQSLNAYTPELNRYKLRSRISLLPQEFVEPYLYVQAEIEAYTRQQTGPEMQMMMSGGVDELAISGMQRVTNGLRLTVSYPASFSGQVWSVYQQNTPACILTNMSGGSGGGTPPPPDGTNGVPCTNCVSCMVDLTNSFNGLESAWALLFNNLVLTGETATSWTDTQPMGSDTNGNPVHRFYGVGSNADPDNDELHSGYELFVSHTDEADADSDDDGLSDGWEMANGFNPNDGAGANGSSGDLDADGLSNAEEQEAGTDPRVANPVHEVGPDEVVFEYRSAEVARSKPGFVNFVTDTSGVVRCYLEFESYGEVSSPYSMGDHGTWSCSRSVDPVSGKTPMPGDTGAYEGERSGGQWWNSALNVDYQSTGTWWLASLHEDSQGSIPESFSWTGSCHSDDPLDCWYASFYGNIFYSIDTYWWPDAAVTILPTYRAGYDLGYSREDFLANEYTTDMLTNHAWQTLANAPTLSNLAWGTGWVHQTSRGVSLSNYEQIVQVVFTNAAQTTAYHRITSNEARCDLARTGYRLRIPTQSGVVSRVRVVEWFVPEEEAPTMNQMSMMSEGSVPPVARTSRVAVVLGNGGTQVVERGYFVIDPPTNKGVVFVGVLKVDLKELEFKQDNPVRNDSGSAYSGADWQDNDLDGDVVSDAPDKRQPVSYKRGEQISVTAKWEVAPASGLDVSNWRVRGTGPDGIKIGFVGGGKTVALAGSTLSMAETTCDASTQLPNTVRYYSSFEISWELSLDGGTTWPCSAEKSDNLLYVTYGEPQGSMCHTPLHIGCFEADTKSSRDDVVAEVFDKYETLAIKPVDPKTGAEVGSTIKYYGSGAVSPDYSQFLASGNGACGTWAQFLVDVYNIQGISDCEMINIGPDPWTTYLAPYVPDIPTPGSWSIHAIKVKSSANGQGPTSPPSQSQFCNHFVITTAIGGVGRILDPSYGKEWVGTAGDPIGLHAFQTGSLEWIYWTCTPPLPGAVAVTSSLPLLLRYVEGPDYWDCTPP